MMKKIGIVTIIDYYNFGNRLQNYAVSYILNKRLGCKAITLEGYKDQLIQGGFYRWAKERLVLQLCRIPSFAEKHLNPRMVRWFNFSEWSRRWIPRKRFYNCDRLPGSVNAKFDLFITGSDQVWNYRIKNFRPEDFFLSFAEDKKKNSLSASFGVDQLPEAQRQLFRHRLSGFSHISVREDAGAGIVKELTGKDAVVLLDPVMALNKDEWIRVEKNPKVDISKPYVLKYYLGKEGKSIDKWAEKEGYSVYELMNEKKKELYSAGPGEFISLIRHASLVCSDSFHCIAFSILFSIPFIVYERQGTEDYMTSRLDTLLGKFGFQNRWEHMLCPEEYLHCDFKGVPDQLKKEQTKFMDYLKSIVQN